MHYHTDERNEMVEYLATRFPKCFFGNPLMRRPLKHNIILDLEKANVLDDARRAQVLEWYTNHFRYRMACSAGVERIDLDGNKAGVVTPDEAARNRHWVQARKAELAQRAADALELTERQRAAIAARAAIVAVAKPPATNGDATMHPSLKEIETAITAASGLLSDARYEGMRPVLVTATMKEVIAAAERVIRTLVPPDYGATT